MRHFRAFYNTIAVVKADGSVEQRTSYYPYGEPHRDPYASASSLTEAKPNRYLFGGKQYMTQDGLKYYNFEARDLLSTIGRFATPDPKSDTYPGISHYLYCAANPINATDPTGEDYNVIFSGNVVTIQAFYIVNENNMEIVENAKQFYEGLNGMFVYKVGDEKYDVKFEIIPVAYQTMSNNEKRDAFTKYRVTVEGNNDVKNATNIIHFYQGNPDSGVAGTYGEREIRVFYNLADDITLLHEMGHSLGFLHMESGIMTESMDSPYYNKTVPEQNINECIINSIPDEPNSKTSSSRKDTRAGKGFLINKTTHSNEELKNGILIINKNFKL